MARNLRCAVLFLAAASGVAAQTETDSALAPIAPVIDNTSSGSMPDLHERFQRYLYRTYSWQRMSLLAADTGVDSLLGDNIWGRGMDGFSCRYAHRFGRRVVGNTVEFAAGAILREDLRYRPSTSTARGARLRHAVKSAFLAYRDDGSRGIAYARFAGYTGRALVSPIWYPRAITPRHTLMDVGFGVFDQMQNNMLTEFSPDLKRFGRQTWQALRKR